MSLSLLNCASHVSKLIELCTTDPFLRPYQLRLQTARLRVVRPASACAACSRAEPVIFSEAKNWTSGDRAVARVANTAGGAAAGRGFELCSTHDPHWGFSPYLTGAASFAWSYKGIAARPSPTEPWMVSVISSRTRTWNLGVVVGSVCVRVCGVWYWCVSVHEQILQLYLDERQKKLCLSRTVTPHELGIFMWAVLSHTRTKTIMT